jgi:plastocyanin
MRIKTQRVVGASLTGAAPGRGNRPFRSWLGTSLSVVVLATTAACAGGGEAEPAASSESASSATASDSAATSESAAEEVVITISDFAFDVPESVPPGAQVTVVNEDSSFHTVTSDDGAFDVGARNGEPVTFTAPEEPGEYPFHCTPHPNMTATLVVA